MDPSINRTLLCLIPKCPNAVYIKSYRPIGLCNTLYRLITKITVFRITPFLSKIIGPSQASFLANRKASDHAIIIQEFITHFKKIKGKQGNMILKIDYFAFPSLLSNSLCPMSLPHPSLFSLIALSPRNSNQLETLCKGIPFPLPLHSMHRKAIQGH